jgi:hypothetical protein
MSQDVVEMSQDVIDELRDKCRKSLFFLARAVLGFTDLDVNIHLPICIEMQKPENTRMLVMLPRSWFKSTVASIAYPIWLAINNSDIRILIVQNSMTNAKKKISSIKQIFDTNALLQTLFPELMPRGDRPWSSDCLTVNRKISAPEGTFEPAGTGTAVTSRHYDVIIQDDTVAPDFDQMSGEIQQPTQLEIEKAIGWHKLCHPLLIHPIRSQIIIVGTRWAKEDLLGWVIKNSSNYKIISRSALERPGYIGEPASKEQGGVPIWERFDQSVLDELEVSLGTFMFSLLYLNIATNSINQVFKRSYIKYYDTVPFGLLYCTSVDPAPSDSAGKRMDSDYNAIVTTGVDVRTGIVYVAFYSQLRGDPGEIIEIIFHHYQVFKPVVVKVESVAYQKTLCYWIQRRQEELNKRFYIEQVKNAKISKKARILALQPWFAADKIRLKPGQNDLERELLSFDPNKQTSAHDDIIDALSMHVDFWTRSLDLGRANDTSVEEAVDQFTGQAILDEMLGRSDIADKYPYDIGHMNERVLRTLPRHNYIKTFNN